MNIAGLIVEYNPFHNGHAYHFTEAKKLAQADAVIAVMSGDFLQRGEPAIVSKWARTEMALQVGVDLVLELPVAYAVQPAEWFAYGAVALLEATGVTTHLCFGSEAGALDVLQPLAERLADESAELQAQVAEELATGASYPAAYAAAAARVCAAEGCGGLDAAAARAMLEQPNNSLGLHYMIALRRLGSGITPLTLRRLAADYRDAAPRDAAIASATAVRNLLAHSGLTAAVPYLPASTADIMAREFAAGRGPITWESFAQPLFHRLLLCSPEELAEHHEMTEGLEHRIKKLLPKLKEPTVEHLLQQLKTKRYTHTKLQRMLFHVLLQSPSGTMFRTALSGGPGYLRVLGFSSTGRELLKRMKKTASLPIVTRAAELNHPHLSLDIQASGIYANGMANRSTSELMRDYRQPPIQL
ncbi:Predicted nucleotidyltransferase [Fontibacillus panacisegetis]|uniref:tRNA(Met) cytidine acetate ligase n=1 Tax=Fontibacillus panacisegetis TaxID=670482 RepID=A0A1G7F5P1_9BACL|nr:nucleotidyltransferase [Fontibacillus panacisegetis]SDE71201.1 Predicted nucleotidyltransferase [Fontibacillus panacisegetis]